MKYYLSIQKKVILPFAATWMDVESFILSIFFLTFHSVLGYS